MRLGIERDPMCESNDSTVGLHINHISPPLFTQMSITIEEAFNNKRIPI